MGVKNLVMQWSKIQIVVLGISVLFRCTDSVDLPRFVGPGSNVTVAVGRDAALTCRVDNLQTFKVAWLRVDTQTILTIAGHVITKNHRIAVSHGDGAWTLALKDVGPADGGRYMCQVNTEPMMSQTHQLQVVVPPDIDDDASSSEILIKEGENAALRCVASGTPPPTVAWRREDSRHFKIDNQTLVSKWTGDWLNLTGVERAASGAYLCIATNGVPPSVSKRIQINIMCDNDQSKLD
ncbi:neurotrimin-like [Ostrinia furnacalis]|uniref:neurotrimin-like n=1 Tax=Ostrinia furnacalis TaxID=93504 RepID=UPI00103A6645|nr:neurotrimin-like [Ostrinia furnacalis]